MKTKRVNDSIVINLYDNGFMVEINGQGEDDCYTTDKLICTGIDQVLELIREISTMQRNM